MIKFKGTSHRSRGALHRRIIRALCVVLSIPFGITLSVAKVSSDHPFYPVSHVVLPFDWGGFITNRLHSTPRIYQEYVERMNRPNLYPRVLAIRTPVYLPAKRGIDTLLNQAAEGDQEEKSPWDFCDEEGLARVQPVWLDDGQGNSVALSYVATGKIRADATKPEGPYKRVVFHYAIIGTAIQKLIREIEVFRQNTDHHLRLIAADSEADIRIFSFGKESLPYVLILSSMRCVNPNSETDSCAGLDPNFLELFIKSLKLVGGIPPSREERTLVEDLFAKENDRSSSEALREASPMMREPKRWGKSSKIRYQQPGKLFETKRVGVKEYSVYEKDLTAPILGRPYSPRDHKELIATIQSGKRLEQFFAMPWRDSFCSTGSQSDQRCQEGMGYLWQDLFVSTCRRNPWTVVFAYPFSLPLGKIMLSISPHGAVLLGKAEAVKKIGSQSLSSQSAVVQHCEYWRTMLLVNINESEGFSIRPLYSSIVHAIVENEQR